MSLEDVLAGVDTTTLTTEAKLLIELVRLQEEDSAELVKIRRAMEIATEEELDGSKE